MSDIDQASLRRLSETKLLNKAEEVEKRVIKDMRRRQARSGARQAYIDLETQKSLDENYKEKTERRRATMDISSLPSKALPRVRFSKKQNKASFVKEHPRYSSVSNMMNNS